VALNAPATASRQDAGATKCGLPHSCGGKVAAKRKSPDRWPGRTFLQELLYQTSNPLVKHKISLFFELKKNRTFQKAGALAPA
jgi:hypothetical protein